jgi:CheY-like chemotaxis protein
MTNEFKLNHNHIGFIFENEDDLNIFNLLRIMRSHTKENDVFINICSLNIKQQSLILSKFHHFLGIYDGIVPNKKDTASIRYSKVDAKIIESLCAHDYIVQDDDIILFDVQLCLKKDDIQNPHLVKNVRGAVLLSLVQDLLKLGKIDKTFSLFDDKSPIFLHASSLFLFNKENAKMVWDILERWEAEINDNIEINKRIYKISEAQKELNLLSDKVSKSSIDDSAFKYLFESINLTSKVYNLDHNIHVWFIDDQHANGWSKLMDNLLSAPLFIIEAFSSTEDVSQQLHFLSQLSSPIIPDLAIVDLRLDSNDIGVEAYNAQDLSGFKVVDMLLKEWSGISIMIASASNKLWNMEKAIQKGAVSYWRKSDDIASEATKSALLTAFNIHMQFIDKFSTALKKLEYRYIFKIVESIRFEVKCLDDNYNPLKLAIENYFDDLGQKTSWMCWRKENHIKVNDGLFLGITEIYNELENCLWVPTTQKLVLVPNQNVQNTDDRTDKKIINDTLDHIDRKYEIGGQGLKECYEKNKGIRNKLPIIHGSQSKQDVKHAELIDIESSLLIILCLIIELKSPV